MALQGMRGGREARVSLKKPQAAGEELARRSVSSASRERPAPPRNSENKKASPPTKPKHLAAKSAEVREAHGMALMPSLQAGASLWSSGPLFPFSGDAWTAWDFQGAKKKTAGVGASMKEVGHEQRQEQAVLEEKAPKDKLTDDPVLRRMLTNRYGSNLPRDVAALKRKLNLESVSQFPDQTIPVILHWAKVVHDFRNMGSDIIGFMSSFRRSRRVPLPEQYRVTGDGIVTWNEAFPANWRNPALLPKRDAKPKTKSYRWAIEDGVLLPQYSARPTFSQIEDAIAKVAILSSHYGRHPRVPLRVTAEELGISRATLRQLSKSLERGLRNSEISLKDAQNASMNHRFLQRGIGREERRQTALDIARDMLQQNGGDYKLTAKQLRLSLPWLKKLLQPTASAQ
jgi:hypothetical protein